MIRFNKPVRILEWGEGTNTTNQIWTTIGEGDFQTRKVVDGITTLVVQTKEPIKKVNQNDSTVKLAQLSEGMAANSEYWGEVAIGKLKSLNGNLATIEIPYATKISGAANFLQRLVGLP